MNPSNEKRILITGGSGFIGTNLVDYFLQHGWNVLNIDKNPPRNPEHQAVWCNIDILEPEKLISVFQTFQPSKLLHFAARTDLDGKNCTEDYAANINGVQNIINATKLTPSIKRVIIASSQLVCKIGYQPNNDEDYCPNTFYGESKVFTEKIVRSSDDLRDVIWTIVRPTSIWGPWFDIPYKSFFEMISKGLYVHAAGITTYKQWGFVFNSVYQIMKILEAPIEQIDRKTFYLADYNPMILRDFANLIQMEFKTKRIPSIPYWLLQIAGYAGDILQHLGLKTPPLSSFRLNNIVTNEIQNLTELKKVTGPLPYDERKGVHITVEWQLKNGIK